MKQVGDGGAKMVQRETKGECLLWMFAMCVCYNISRRPLLVHFLDQTTFFISIK